MTYRRRALIASMLLTISLMGCGDRDASPALGSSSSFSVPAITDRWLGQWNGPEGTSLRLAGGQGKYEITIQNLDSPHTFQGSAAVGQIQFERNGLKESIHASQRTAPYRT
jgi:hypothetical protein